jgi:hypothetical protein
MVRRLQATSIADRRENEQLKRKAANLEGRDQRDDTDEDEDEGEHGRLKRKKQSEEDDAGGEMSAVRRSIKRFTLCHALWILDIDKLTGPLREFNELGFAEGGRDRAQALSRELRPLLPEALVEEISRAWFKSEVR